jgi:hypothetical protein
VPWLNSKKRWATIKTHVEKIKRGALQGIPLFCGFASFLFIRPSKRLFSIYIAPSVAQHVNSPRQSKHIRRFFLTSLFCLAAFVAPFRLVLYLF